MDRTIEQQRGDWSIGALADAIIGKLTSKPAAHDREEGRTAAGFSEEQWANHLAHIGLLAHAGRVELGLTHEGRNASEDFEKLRAEAMPDVGHTLRHRRFIRHLAACAVAGERRDLDYLSAQVFGVVSPAGHLGIDWRDYRTIILGNAQEREHAPIAALAECAHQLKQQIPYEQAARAAGLTRDQGKALSRFFGAKEFRAAQQAGPKERWVALARSSGWSGAEFARRWNAAVDEHGQKVIGERTARNWLGGMAA